MVKLRRKVTGVTEVCLMVSSFGSMQHVKFQMHRGAFAFAIPDTAPARWIPDPACDILRDAVKAQIL
jgi:hypothetical protein